ncbi:MAG TPA: hypothetical protein VLH60_05405, partial [Sedimentisphaerales bacterium]|nr:hypothetical protein [Sedimentisphaerales bacterium]
TELKRKIALTALPNDSQVRFDETSAGIVEERLRKLAWLTDVVVETTTKGVLISADYRRPIALVELPASHGAARYYLSEEKVVLDYVPMDTLPIVRITGIADLSIPAIGQVWRRDDVSAAIAILQKLNSMDHTIIRRGEPPLLSEIESIDVANLDGRRDGQSPHIVLHAKDGTQILWGARLGMSARYMEANDEEKLVMLYMFFEQPRASGGKPTIQGRVKYVELRIPRGSIPRPTIPRDDVSD